MLYSTLTNEELARWVCASPADDAALAELLRRAPALAAGESDRIQELVEDQDKAECEHNNETDRLNEEINEANERTRLIEAKLAASEDRHKEIAKLALAI